MNKLRTPSFSIRLLDEANAQASPDKKVQLMRVGKFYTVDDDTIDITADMLGSMVKNFSDRVRGIDLAIDYKHESDDIAAGWIKNLYLMNEGQELWAEVDWTPKGQKILSDKEFRYLSADFTLDYRHNETNERHGPTLLGGGLTNRPFIKEMEPVVELSETMKGTEMDPKDKEIADLKAQIVALQKQLADMKAGEGKMEMGDLEKQNKELQDKVHQYEEEKKLSEKKGRFDKLMLDGKVVEAQREAFMKDDTVKFAENAQIPNLKGSGNSQEPPVSIKNKEDAEAQIMKLAEQKVQSKEVKTLGEGIQKVLRENKDLMKVYVG